MGQDLERIRKAYDSTAEEYSEKYFEEHEKKPIDLKILSRFAQTLEVGTPVWDLGCGPGQTVRLLNSLGIQAAGMDLSPETVRKARANCPTLEFRTGDMLATVFPDKSLGGAISFYSIVHFTPDQVEQAFREVFRILRPGGTFLLAFHVGDETLHLDEFMGKSIDVDFMLFTIEFISSHLEKAGFCDLEISEREPIPDVEYDSRRAYIFARKPA